MSKIRGEDTREFDTTQLHESGHGQLVHRDYASHFFRWGFAGRLTTNKDHILEVGCGQDTPFAKVLTSMSLHPPRYVGVDLNKPRKKQWKAGWAEFFWEFNFIKDHKKLKGGFTKAVCFEVIEHMQKPSGLLLLKGIHSLLKPGGLLLLSTPVYNGKWQAKNHIHEYTIEELDAHVKKAGFKVERRHGTFMSATEVKAKKGVLENHLFTYEALRAYYSDEVLATFLAPLYPDLSRNNLWVLKK